LERNKEGTAMHILNESTLNKIKTLKNMNLIHGDPNSPKLSDIETLIDHLEVEIYHCLNLNTGFTDPKIQKIMGDLAVYIAENQTEARSLEVYLAAYAYMNSTPSQENSAREGFQFAEKCSSGWLHEFISQHQQGALKKGHPVDSGKTFFKREIYISALSTFYNHTSSMPSANKGYLFWDLMEILVNDPLIAIYNTDHKQAILDARKRIEQDALFSRIHSNS
jgi:hypothetical protein